MRDITLVKPFLNHLAGYTAALERGWSPGRKRGAGRAKQALALMLQEARQQELDYIELTADPGNVASQRVVQACGGRLVERFRKAAAYGGSEALRFRIELRDDDHPVLENGSASC